jgi:hypothetical protein
MQGALIEGYTNKVPKVVVGALDATLQILRYVRPYRQHGDVYHEKCAVAPQLIME